MERSSKLVVLFIISLLASTAFAQGPKGSHEIIKPKGYTPPPIAASTELNELLAKAVEATIGEFKAKNFTPNDVSATLIVFDDKGGEWQQGEVRGNERIYPASVVKLFYMAALERQIEDGKVTVTPELERGLRDMIVDSSNEATQYILDVLTDTSSGAELPTKQFEAWQYKRNRVNRYFASMGYENINVNQKTFCEDAYGIEQQSRNYKGENRNMLTTDAVARLLAEIVSGRIAGKDRTAEMMTLLHRDPFGKGADDDQAHAFTGRMLIDRKLTGAKIWSKAGWTSKTRHDAAYIEMPDGLKFVLVTFTVDHANDTGFIPALAGKVLDALTRTEHH